MSTRISTAQMFQGAQTKVALARDKENNSSERSSSLKELQHPSDNPGGWVIAANLKNEMAMNDSMAKTGAVANHVMAATEGVLSQLQDYTQRAHELAISASSTTAPKGRDVLVSEATALYDNVLRALNTRYAGRTLLAGYKSQGPAFDHDGDFVGDNHPFELEVDWQLNIPSNISSQQAILGAGLREGVDIPSAFIRLIDGLKSEDVDTVRGTLDDFMKAVDQLSVARSQIGARINESNQAQDAHTESKIRDSDVVSKIEEADPIKAFSDLARDQTVLRAAISTSEKVLKDNPADILFK